MTTDIERYLNSLSEDITILDISYRDIKSLPDLTRFKNLKILHCSNNQLTSLPSLPQNLKILYCFNNQLTSLLTLPQQLKILDCSGNQLTLLPTLMQNLNILYCFNNQLTSLPILPQKLKILDCHYNELTSLPILPQNIVKFDCSKNPISKIVNSNILIKTKQNIQILNDFRDLYYCLKFKNQFRKWLWEKVREPNAKKLYDPIYLIEHLEHEDDLEAVLNNW